MTPSPVPDYARRIIEQVADIPVWQRTEKEQRIMTLYELSKAQKARRKRARRG